ncbi:hypothetical protein CC2G_006577 [Coprinopsis cinerea AmutBmut pab1-1]|nr:hypothetical protein CC2G_006577 [Coprinopsis cinerea AmutBmut pab1-1]
MVYGVQPSQEMASDMNDKPLPLVARTENATTIPFNLLPDDVVGDIFIEYLRERSGAPLSGAPTNLAVTVHGSGSTNTPILLTFVCARWRRLSCSLPFLWSCITVLGASPTTGTIRLIEMWLSRSGFVPLTVRFQPGRGGGEVSPFFDEAFHLLTAQSHRWKEFSMFDREYDDRPPRNHVWKEIRAPNLENLIVFFGKRWSPGSAFQLMKTFSSSEKLKSLNSTLTCPHVATPISTPSIVVPELKTMHFVYLRRFPRFLDSLTFPSLEDLDMMKIIAGAISPTAYADLWRTLAELGERSEWRLRRLRFPAIRKLDVDVPHGVEILATSHSFVHLTSLTLACPLVDDALELLTFREGYEPLPRVATMLLLDCRSTDGVLSAMIKSRTAIRSTGLTPALQDINAYFCRFGPRKPTNEWPRDTSLEIPGIRVYICYHSWDKNPAPSTSG